MSRINGQVTKISLFHPWCIYLLFIFQVIFKCKTLLIDLRWQIFARLWEISASQSNSDAFPHTVHEPRKQKWLDFSNGKKTFNLIQFVNTDFGKLHFSGDKSDNRE